MVTGGVASVFYGDPRFTRDVDLVIDLDVSGVDRLSSAFDADDFYLPPPEALRAEVQRRPWGHFNVIHRATGLRADVYVHAGDDLESWALERRRRVDVGDTAVWLAPVEYVIVRKLEYYRDSQSDRHLRDVAMMMAVSPELIDRSVVAEWVAKRSLNEQWQAALAYPTLE